MIAAARLAVEQIATLTTEKTDTEMLNWLAVMTEGVQKVYIEPVGWIYLDRDSIHKAMQETGDAAE